MTAKSGSVGILWIVAKFGSLFQRLDGGSPEHVNESGSEFMTVSSRGLGRACSSVQGVWSALLSQLPGECTRAVHLLGRPNTSEESGTSLGPWAVG